jgi:hypothetical protein
MAGDLFTKLWEVFFERTLMVNFMEKSVDLHRGGQLYPGKPEFFLLRL